MESSSSADTVPVAIVGAGPVGLAMALGLARQGVRSVLLEKKDSTSRTSKAPGLHVRTREVLRHWGVEDRFLEAGRLFQPLTLHDVRPGNPPLISLDFSELSIEADRPGLLILEQNETERLLLEAVRESGLCEVRFGAEVIGLAQDARGVRLTFRQEGAERGLTAEFAVGCDGASSFIREALGLPFDGFTYSLRPMLADIALEDERDDLSQPRGYSGSGAFEFTARLRPGLWRIVHLARREPDQEEVTHEEVAERVARLLGPGPFEVVWSSRFRIHVRSSPRFRVGRVLLAGDAAHVHSPASGFGMNGGIQDADNLAWKLAHALRGGDVDRLLDSYEVERRSVVVEQTSRYADLITRVFLQAPRVLRESAWVVLRKMMKIGSLRRSVLRRTAMIDLGYRESPLLKRDQLAAGRRLPNPLLRAPDGRAVRLYELLPDAPVILDVAEERGFARRLPVDRVIRIGPGAFEEPSGLLRGLLDGRDGWILVRPDAYVAWARHKPVALGRETRDALGYRQVHGRAGAGGAAEEEN